MIRTPLPLLALALLAACGPATPPAAAPAPIPAALQSLVMAERTFARIAGEQGITPAFLGVLAEDGVLFRPTAVQGKTYLSAQPPAPGHLSWIPAFAEIASDGNFGYTTGPWEYRRQQASDPAEAFGQYVSVWRREGDGPWRLAIDAGVNHGPHLAPPPRVDFAPIPPARASQPLDSAAEHTAMVAAERALADRLLAGDSSAYLASLTDDARVYRDGVYPVVGLPAIAAQLGRLSTGSAWRTDGSGIAASGDLGYTYGTLDIPAGGGPARPGIFLHVWRRTSDGSWRLALDLAHPVEPAT